MRTVSDLASPLVHRVALADPRAVPAGRYAEAYLRKLGLWETIRPKVVPTENVRGALAAVDSGNVEAAIVYKTDALISKGVRVAIEVPRERGPDIRYALASIKEAPHAAAAHRFLDYLCQAEAGAVFERFGFLVVPEPKQ